MLAGVHYTPPYPRRVKYVCQYLAYTFGFKLSQKLIHTQSDFLFSNSVCKLSFCVSNLINYYHAFIARPSSLVLVQVNVVRKER